MPRPSILRAALAPVLAAVLVVGGCGEGGDRDPDEVRDDIAEELEADGRGLSSEDARCVAGVLVDDIGAERLEDVDLSAEEPPEDLADDLAAAALAALDRCELDPGALER